MLTVPHVKSGEYGTHRCAWRNVRGTQVHAGVRGSRSVEGQLTLGDTGIVLVPGGLWHRRSDQITEDRLATCSPGSPSSQAIGLDDEQPSTRLQRRDDCEGGHVAARVAKLAPKSRNCPGCESEDGDGIASPSEKGGLIISAPCLR